MLCGAAEVLCDAVGVLCDYVAMLCDVDVPCDAVAAVVLQEERTKAPIASPPNVFLFN
jgi:hypothetical protein